MGGKGGRERYYVPLDEKRTLDRGEQNYRTKSRTGRKTDMEEEARDHCGDY